METTGHVVGMLDRDQRTARITTRFSSDLFENFSDTFVPNFVTDCFANRTDSVLCYKIPHARTYSYFSKWKHQTNYFKTCFKNLQNILVVVFCIILAVPSVWSAPVPNMDSPRPWWTPCRSETTPSYTETRKPDLIKEQCDVDELVNQIDIALRGSNNIRDLYAYYVNTTLKNPQTKEFYKNQSNSWMVLPDSLRRDITEFNAESIKHDDTLLDAYEFFQRVAVGLEQAMLQEPNPVLHKGFENASSHLNQVLCEIYYVFEARSTIRRPNIDRDIMTSRDRMLDTTNKTNRDFMTLRDLIKALKFVYKAFGGKMTYYDDMD